MKFIFLFMAASLLAVSGAQAAQYDCLDISGKKVGSVPGLYGSPALINSKDACNKKFSQKCGGTCTSKYSPQSH
ncbi:MAG: hypothetical protein H0X26_06290 [Alphaproteobacteria bacterium]|nr:hypothetical protein [Alphaproteobacteria bacterium]